MRVYYYLCLHDAIADAGRRSDDTARVTEDSFRLCFLVEIIVRRIFESDHSTRLVVYSMVSYINSSLYFITVQCGQSPSIDPASSS